MMHKHLVLLQLAVVAVSGFVPLQQRATSSRLVHFSSPQFQEEVDDAAVQWDLFNKHHAKGSWRGVWTTHDYIGDVIDESVASVNLNANGDNLIEQTHTIVVGAKQSDCATCFDSMETKTLPVAQYTPENLRKSRFAAVSMVNGPTLLRSGVMATELILKHGDGRVRVTFQHAPVWEQGVEPGSCPPQGLKIFRAMISREALRDTAPTPEMEGNDPPTEGNPIFFRPVPPFNWHKKWSGTSWTWGPQAGNRGWEMEEMEETDAWQGITPVENWNLRLGSIHIQCPRIINDASVGICRLAWLPDDETLLRVEGGVQALRPMIVEDDMMIGFEPPSLTSLRCDMMKKVGELENAHRPSRALKKDDEKNEDAVKPPNSSDNEQASTDKVNASIKESSSSSKPDKPESGLDAIRDALSL
jgi:hypothetical protein